MKFRWKIFFIFTSFIAVACSIFGVWMVNATFQASLGREIERGNSGNQMFQFAFEMALDSMSDELMILEDTVISDVAGSLKNSMGNNSYIRIYNEEEKLLFDDSRMKMDTSFISKLEGSNSGYEIIMDNDVYYLTIMCKSQIKGNTYYLENIMEISYVYEERKALFETYRIAILVLLVSTGIVILLLSHFLTRSVVVLSNATRRFSDGDYRIRARRQSSDEIGELTTDFNTMAETLSQKMEQLSQEARRQEDFTASFAHELKTPLTSIIGYADMIRTIELDKEETLEAAGYIYSQGKRLESLSLKLLELIVTEKGEYVFSIVPTRMLMEEVEKIVLPSLEKKNIELVMEFEDAELLGDKDLLISLFVNLTDNARKALGENGRISIQGRDKETGYEIMVKDNGCGIPEEELDKITEAFYMVDKSRARKEGGAGLGMTLCSKIVHIHGAKWYIQSRPGEGTSIWVTLQKAAKGGEKA